MPEFPKIRRPRFELKSMPLTSGLLAACDLVLLATDHDAFEYAIIGKSANLIVDTRGRSWSRRREL